MPASTKEETLLIILKESAVKKYGEERAKILEPSLQDLARALVAIEYPLRGGTFFCTVTEAKSREQRAESKRKCIKVLALRSLLSALCSIARR
jgi:hypothetical protein